MDDETLSDEELVKRCLNARDSFTLIYQRYASALNAFLLGMHCGDRFAAEDTLQETFFRAYKGLSQFDTSRPLKPWLFRIAMNVFLDEKRGPKHVESADPHSLPETESQDDNPAKAAAVADTYNQLVNHCAKVLAPRKLAAFLLAKGQGLSYEEIAEVHNCSPATVKRDLSEAFHAMTTAAKELGLIKSKNN
jgi:RNA polymerase sigma-70 factor, ECF subfamily